jgi:CheY-specific phosphatase CheX
MDKPAMTEAMRASISEVLEQMFFMPVDFITPDTARQDPEPVDGSIIAKLGFSGSLAGTFMLQVPRPLAQSVSADFLGTAPSSLSDSDVAGTVLEMANMLVGGALSIYDSQTLYDLQIPQLISKQDMGAFTGQCCDGIVIRVQTLENRMTFQLILQE